LAAVGAGIYSDPISPLADIVRIKETVEPEAKQHAMYEDMFGLWRRIYHNVLQDMDDHRSLLERYDFR